MYGTPLIGETTQVYGRRQKFIRLPIQFRRYRSWNVSSPPCWNSVTDLIFFHLDAWRKVTNVDPLADSDDEDGHAHHEYSKLLCIFSLSLVVDVIMSAQRLRVVSGFLSGT